VDLADKVGRNGQLASASVEKDREPDSARPSIIEQTMDCRSNRTARVKNVIDQDDVSRFDFERNRARADFRIRQRRGRIIAVKRNVNRTYRYLATLGPTNLVRQSSRYRNTAPPNSDDSEMLSATGTFHDFRRNPSQDTCDRVGIHYNLFVFNHWARFTLA
jgi:hypothetical protein